MRPGERITLINESARLLETREWPEIDLIIGQHGLPTSNDYHPDHKYSYVIDMIGSAKDEQLTELHTYLVGGDAEPPDEAQPWTPGLLKLFASHLATHQAYVGQVSQSLSYSGVSAFVAHTSIDASAEWQEVIEGALRTCDAMVIFLHTGFHESKWCDQEVGFALARRIPILVITYDLMPYGFIGKYQAIRGAGVSEAQTAKNITDWLTASPTAQEPMTEGLVHALTNSPSYERTRQLITQIEKMPRFTPAQLERLDAATKTNSQVADANRAGIMVPLIVRQLIAKHGGVPLEADPWTNESPF